MKYKKNKSFLSNRKGYVLFNVLIMIVILSILFTAANLILQYNLRQITMQERNLKAHYIARSGAVLAYTAIADESNETLLNEIATKNYEAGGIKDTLEFHEENAKVSLTSWFNNGNIIIKSEAELIDLSTKSIIYLVFDKNNPNVSNWKTNIN